MRPGLKKMRVVKLGEGEVLKIDASVLWREMCEGVIIGQTPQRMKELRQ